MSTQVLAGGITAEIVHTVPGRIRVRIGAFQTRPGFAEAFATAFAARAGIRRVRVNQWCASAVIEYDPDVLTFQDTRRALVETTVTAPVPYEGNGGNGVAPVTAGSGGLIPAVRRLAPPWAQFAVSGLAFAAGLVGLPPWVVQGLTAAAIVPIVGRAVTTVVTERRAGVDLLDGTAAVLMTVQGRFVSAGFMVTLIALGELIRERTARRSQAMLDDLLGMAGRSAWVVRGERRVRVPANQVKVGETVVVYTGDMVPVDGIILRGQATVDQRSLTGESMPVEIGPGEHAYAATVVVDGKIYLRCEAAGDDTRAGRVVDAVRAAPLHETRAQNYAALLADRMVWPVLLTAGASFALTQNLSRAVSILIIDFATGIRIAAPTAVLASMQQAARHGILIKGGGALERLAGVDAIMFDKTGTLTRGEPRVTEVISVNGRSADEVLRFAAGAEQRLKHPAALAIVRHARRHGVVIPERAESVYTLGMGVQAEIEGLPVLVGSRRLMEASGIPMGPVEAAQAAVRARGESLGYVAIGGYLAGLIAYNDPLRPEVAEVISALRARGVQDIVMVTGDNEAPARAAAEEAGIYQVVAGAFPEEKAEVVKRLRAQGRTVAVVGDGINDSPALAHADVAISLRGGADVARERADVVLTDDNLRRIPEAIDIARGGMGLVRQNMMVVAVPNGAGLALAATGMIGPAAATLLNNGSAILAAVNSLRPLLGSRPLPVDPTNGEG